MTLKNDYLQKHAKEHSVRTIDTYLWALGIFEEWLLTKNLADLTPKDMLILHDWIDKRLGSNKSKNLVISAIKSFMGYAYDLELIKEQVYLRLHFFKVTNKPKNLSNDTYYKIFSFAQDRNENYAIFLCFLRFSGLRVSEALAVEHDDIHWHDEKYYAVINNVVGKGGESSSAYFVPLLSGGNKQDYVDLKKYCRGQKGLIFEQYNRFQVAVYARRLSRALRIRFTCHTMRHAFAFGMLNHNIEIPKISHFMRHKNTKVTEEVYLKTNQKLRNEYTEKLISTLMGNENEKEVEMGKDRDFPKDIEKGLS